MGNASASETSEMRETEIAGLSIWPNPSGGDRIHVTLQDKQLAVGYLRVLDSSGREVTGARWNTSEQNAAEVVFTETLRPGIYLVQLVSGGGMQSTRFIVAGAPSR
jgi:hypothetical protein